MKWLIYLFTFILYQIFIGKCDIPSSETLKQQQKESFEACMAIKRKAPFINLNCNKILKNISNMKSTLNEKNGIKTLSKADFETRKVNEKEEIKLRNLIMKLYSGNKLGQK